MDAEIRDRRETGRRLAIGLLALAFVSSLAAGAFGGPYEDATAAFGRGDFATAYRLIRPMAEQGSAKAQYNLAIMYYNGYGVPQDLAETAKWYRKAADQGHPAAQYNLGVMYHEGEGVPQDFTEAARWFRKAADQGMADAQYNLGIMYDKGEGVPQDAAEMVKWYRKAADQGLATAQFTLGVLYRNGRGVPQNNVLAYMWLSLAIPRFSAPDVQKRDIAFIHRGIIASKMTPAQLAEAKRRARDWKPEKAKKTGK